MYNPAEREGCAGKDFIRRRKWKRIINKDNEFEERMKQKKNGQIQEKTGKGVTEKNP